jgi:hypothetical protein
MRGILSAAVLSVALMGMGAASAVSAGDSYHGRGHGYSLYHGKWCNSQHCRWKSCHHNHCEWKYDARLFFDYQRRNGS